MEIGFASVKCKRKCTKLADIYNTAAKKGRVCKDRNANIYAKIISFFASCDNFDMVMKAPSFKTFRGHALTGNLKGKWSFDMEHPKRFVFAVVCDKRRKDGSFDYASAKKIYIHDIVDYH